MNVIGTVGLPGSGKGEAANVAEAADIPVVVMGDVIRAECRRRGLDPAQHHGRIAGALRERDDREIELGLGETLERADVEIDNTDSLAAFRERVREVLGIESEAGDSAEMPNAGGDSA